MVAERKFGWRDYGTAAMYADGKILVAGGADPPTATAEVIDLNAATPSWRSVASMSIPRRHLNSTLLPDGTVLVTGGTYGPGHNNAGTPVFAAELWNPATETWTTLASASVPRLYHSSAMLLPDGRVMTNGGERNISDRMAEVEVFSPPYLFKGARPTMSGAPASIGWGQRFTVQSPDAANISKVTLIRLGSPTHAFDMNQRLNVLQFTRGAGTVDITTPANANLAPPGHYMLFIVNGNGVPSVGSIVQISGSAPPPPPPPARRHRVALTILPGLSAGPMQRGPSSGIHPTGSSTSPSSAIPATTPPSALTTGRPTWQPRRALHLHLHRHQHQHQHQHRHRHRAPAPACGLRMEFEHALCGRREGDEAGQKLHCQGGGCFGVECELASGVDPQLLGPHDMLAGRTCAGRLRRPCTGTAPAPAPAPHRHRAPGTGLCALSHWDPNRRYVGGEKVTRLGSYYIAKVVGASVWNVNSPPEWTSSYWGPTTCP